VPRLQHYYEPDALDCNQCCTAIATDFGCRAEIETRYERDKVVVIVKVRKIGGVEHDVVQVQAMVTAPQKGAKSLYVLQYGALLDCWHQLDRGLLGVAQTPMERSWYGRPQQPAKHKQ
jgi:hypothetical protein